MPWEPIDITSKNAVDLEGDLVQVVWSLSTRPTSDWAREFRSCRAPRIGSLDFLRMPSPDVRLGGTIHWTVPAADLKGAVAHVRACVDEANTAYREVLVRRESERRRRAAEDEAKAARLAAAQQALNALD